ncbi:hypothetical protein B0J11DRAFT_581603 [Dendryphion nanum]|uniref:RNB domain-containing protein n=1 Tax=Dendryphion nanum TaxID=256645 RepID=A0A9P9DJW7_9PLEO|nr:hypothetical protein B0J11DRAFT_581603 [Dendryphion nanum]
MSKLSVGAKSDEDQLQNEREEDEDDADEDIMTLGLMLKPGDVVELSAPGREPVLAVFVQQLESNSQFFSVNGRWTHSKLGNVSFVITGCIDPALILPLIPFLPTKPQEATALAEIHVPSDLAVPVKKILEKMTHNSETIYRDNAAAIDNAYSTLADQSRARMMTLTQITKTLLRSQDPTYIPTPAALLAVRKALKHNEFRFRSDSRSARITNVFAIRPKDDVEVVELVHEWIRQFQESCALHAASPNTNADPETLTNGAKFVGRFIVKARRLIHISRQQRHPLHGHVGSSEERFPLEKNASTFSVEWGEPFSRTDKHIITFLQAWVLTKQFEAMHDLQSACSAIVRATECYGKEVYEIDTANEHGAMDNRAGYLLLQELGVISPHDSRAVYDEQLMLPTVRLSRNLELLNSKAELTRRNPDFRDIMADLRHDWGSLEVYCIDGVGALEIDDGISVERVGGDNSSLWLHIHIANPTAFFDKTHVLSGLAAHMTETVYLAERSFPMLPSWVTKNYFSLDNNRPVLTVSAKLDLSTGQVVDKRVRSGIIRQTTSITPTEVSEYLGEFSTDKSRTSLVVGGPVPATPIQRGRPTLSHKQLQDLNDLYAAARILWKRRQTAGAVRMDIPKVECRLFERADASGLSWSPPSLDRARFISGEPIIEVNTRTGTGVQVGYDIDASDIVQEMMVLAGETVATWCSERNIPVIYRGTHTIPGVSPSDLSTVSTTDFREMIREGRKEEIDQMSSALKSKLMRSMGRSIAHYAPISHEMMGVPAYIKATSPLRRFSDMIVHWQVEAALRYEAQTGKKLDMSNGTNSARSILPFSQRQIQESIITLGPRERLIRQRGQWSSRFWAVMAFMRAFYNKEAPLPETFTVSIDASSEKRRLAKGILEGYNLNVEITSGPDGNYYPGDRWEVKINYVSVHDMIISVVPLKLLYRDPMAI